MVFDPKNMRTGIGFDVHAFAVNRALILGGVEIPFHLGLAGYSDADVLIHAIIDSLIGAASIGDIGDFFPDNDPKYKNSRSLDLLKSIGKVLRLSGWEIINIDSIVICQQPKISQYRKDMIFQIQDTLNLNDKEINIKATTTEKLGFTGRGEGIAAKAISLIYKKNP